MMRKEPQVRALAGARIVYLRHLALFVVARRLSGNFLEVANEVGLIIKAAILSHLGQLHPRVVSNHLARFSHALQLLQLCGRQA